ERNDHGTVRLDKGLSSQAGDVILSCLSGAPRGSSIARSTHLYQVATGVDVPFNIAMPIIRAGGCVVTHKPILVKKATVRICHHYEGIPGKSTIGRGVHDYSSTNRCTTPARDGQGGDHPQLVSSIIGHRGIADTIKVDLSAMENASVSANVAKISQRKRGCERNNIRSNSFSNYLSLKK